MAEIHHECGVAAIYHLPGEPSPLCPPQGPSQISRLLPRMLQDIQNRGQLSAGMTSFDPHRDQLIDFLRAIDEGRAPLVDGREGRKSVEIIRAIYRSAREGRPVALPLNDD